ncbi:MAG: oxidoreductase [Thermoplasmata archaeon]|nr:MAG: oxidoreductase [Thermoplasmata archaeon]
MNHYLPEKAEIIDCKEFPYEKKLFRIKANIDFIPGQFVEISLAGIGEFPVSICSAPHEKGYFEICVKKLGKVTSQLFKLNESDFIGYRGPFGNGFPINELKGKDVVIVAGGLGILPLRSFIKEALHNNFCNSLTILYGVKEPLDMLFKEELKEWREKAKVIDVYEEGGKRKGYVSDFIDEANLKGNEYALVCGPPAMFKPVINQLKKNGIENEKIYLSIERRMKCGIGKCGHCIVGGEYYTCIDGPVFNYKAYKKAEKIKL